MAWGIRRAKAQFWWPWGQIWPELHQKLHFEHLGPTGPQTLIIYEVFGVGEAKKTVKHEEIGPAGPQTLVIYEVFGVGEPKAS